MAEVVNKPKKRGLSLESNKHRNDSLSHGEKSVGSINDHEVSSKHMQLQGQHGETQRVRPSFPAVTFTYLNPVSSSARLNQVIKYEQRRGNSQPRHHEWLKQPVTQSFCHPTNNQLINTSVVVSESKPNLAERKLIDADLLKTQKQELERIYRQRLEQKDQSIKKLEDSNKLQESRIDFLHSQLKAAEEKLRAKTEELRFKNDQLNRLKDEHSRELQYQYSEKERLKTLVVESQRACLTSRNKQNKEGKGERRRLDISRMNQVEAKLNRLISDIKK